MKAFKLLGFLWALPMTVLGLLIAATSGASVVGTWGGDIVLLAPGGWWHWIGERNALLGAQTWGHIVLLWDPEEAHMPNLMRHEAAHVRQMDIWGPFFLPAYGIAALAALARKLDPYWDNWFELQAEAWAELDRG